MASLSEMQARREKLAAAIDSGALSIQHGEKRIGYRSFEEMRAILRKLDRDIATASGGKKPTKRYLVATKRGL